MNFKIKISDMAQILTSINRSEVFLYLRDEIIIHINKTGITLSFYHFPVQTKQQNIIQNSCATILLF